jgi:Fe-S-cluster-containing dehydrogenase component/DMSO reductase anchor subunit
MSQRTGIAHFPEGTPHGLEPVRTLVDELLEDQRRLTAVERFSQRHVDAAAPRLESHYRDLLPLSAPLPDEQYAFEVDLDACSGCKGCVTACHSMNGLDDNETWREVGFLVGHTAAKPAGPFRPSADALVIPLAQVVTTACHHCADPGCLNGCPVLAYDKDPLTGIVRHLDDQCMGCSYCILKCPYEVPKYSKERGIVRKCDLCQGRLAAGEAPACVQGCPNEAIRIRKVRTSDLLATHRPQVPATANTFLPGSPDPSVTVPSTLYRTVRSGTAVVPADDGVPRLDPPHVPLVLLLVLSQASAGLALALPFATGFASPTALRMLLVASGVLLSLGMAASVAHLGQPTKAWRAFLGWRRSWLSREILALNLFAGALAAAAAAAWIPALQGLRLPLALAAAAAGAVAVAASAMVYVDTRRPVWDAPRTFGQFVGTTCLLGATLTAVSLGWTATAGHPELLPAVRVAAVLAAVFRAALFVWNRERHRAALADRSSPVHANARALAELLPAVIPVRNGLFLVSTAAGLAALAGPASSAAAWASLSTLTTVTSELLGRLVFFVAGTSRRMPGGIPT